MKIHIRASDHSLSPIRPTGRVLSHFYYILFQFKITGSGPYYFLTAPVGPGLVATHFETDRAWALLFPRGSNRSGLNFFCTEPGLISFFSVFLGKNCQSRYFLDVTRSIQKSLKVGLTPIFFLMHTFLNFY